jgi:hypothetical protein
MAIGSARGLRVEASTIHPIQAQRKIAGRELAIVHHGNLWNVAGPLYKAYRREIRVERDALEAIALRRFALRDDRKARKKEIQTEGRVNIRALLKRP